MATDTNRSCPRMLCHRFHLTRFRPFRSSKNGSALDRMGTPSVLHLSSNGAAGCGSSSVNLRETGMVCGSRPTIQPDSERRPMAIFEGDIAPVPFSVEVGLVRGLDDISDISDSCSEGSTRESWASMSQSNVYPTGWRHRIGPRTLGREPPCWKSLRKESARHYRLPFKTTVFRFRRRTKL